MESRSLFGMWTRGWEVAAHWLAMARAAALLQIFAGGVISLFLGCAWLWLSLTASQRGIVFDYIVCSVKHGAGGCTELTDLFGGRSVAFLLRQWLGRSAFAWLSLMVAVTAAATWYGWFLSRTRHLRGSLLIDHRKERRAQLIKRVGACLALGSIGTLSLHSSAFDVTVLEMWWAYLRSQVLLEWRWLAAVSSLDGQGFLIWYEGPGQAGFRPLEAMAHALAEELQIAHLPQRLTAFGFQSLVCALAWTPAVFQLWKLNNPSFCVAGVPIPSKVENKHFFFFGSPGSGKSMAIKEMLGQIRQKGQRAVVYDCSGEYVKRFYRPDRDIILNPLDKRSAIWTPWADAQTREDLDAMGQSLFPQEGKEPFWADASAVLFAHLAAVLRKKGQCSNAMFAKRMMEDSIDDLREALAGTAALRLIDKEAGAMPHNLMATITSKMAVWRVLPDPGPAVKPFSIREYIRADDDRWLFITALDDQFATLKPLVSLWCDLVATSILSLPESSGRCTWVVLDELSSLQRLPALSPLLEKGRKHGAACLLGVQSMAQLRDKYGRDGADAIAAQPQTWLVLRTAEPETARWLELALGNREIDEAGESLSLGASSNRDGVNLQRRVERRPLVLGSEIISLPDLQGYLRLPGDNRIRKVRYAPVDAVDGAAGFVDRRKT